MEQNKEIATQIFIQQDVEFLSAKMSSTQNMIFVQNISPWVSNEMLASSFSSFGEVKSSLIFVTSEHDSMGSGIVAFASRDSATIAYRRCRDMHFVLTSSPIPVQVSLLHGGNDISLGLPEVLLNTHNPELIRERSVPPRIINQASEEFLYVDMWQKLFDQEKAAMIQLRSEMKSKRDLLKQNISHLLTEEERRKLREKMKGMDKTQRYPSIPSSSSRIVTSIQIPGMEPTPSASRDILSPTRIPEKAKEVSGTDDQDKSLHVHECDKSLHVDFEASSSSIHQDIDVCHQDITAEATSSTEYY